MTKKIGPKGRSKTWFSLIIILPATALAIITSARVVLNWHPVTFRFWDPKREKKEYTSRRRLPLFLPPLSVWHRLTIVAAMHDTTRGVSFAIRNQRNPPPSPYGGDRARKGKRTKKAISESRNQQKEGKKNQSGFNIHYCSQKKKIWTAWQVCHCRTIIGPFISSVKSTACPPNIILLFWRKRLL